MKFSLVFLIGVCAVIAVNGYTNELNTNNNFLPRIPSTYGVIDKLKDFIDEIIKLVQSAVDGLVQQVQKIVDSILDQVNEIINQGEKLLEDILDAVQKRLDDIAKQNEIARQCVEDSQADVDAIVNKTRDQLNECAEKSYRDTVNILDAIEKELKAVQDNIDALNNVIVNCLKESKNGIQATVCILKKGNQLRDDTLEIIKSIGVAVEAATARGIEIAAETTSCVSQTMIDAQESLNKISEQVNQCIENGGNKH